MKSANPKVNIPSQFKIMNMLDPSLRGKTDRRFLKIMAKAIYEHEHNRKFELAKKNNDK